MRLVQGIGYFDGDLQDLIEWQRALNQPLRQRLAFQILHDQVMSALLLADVIESADVGVLQAGDSVCFALEPLAQLGVITQMTGQDLDGNKTIQARVASFIHLAHASRADLGENLIRPEFCSRC